LVGNAAHAVDVNAPLKLGRIWSVPIRGAYSLVALVLLLAGITGWQYASFARGHSVAGYVFAGLFSAALFIWMVFAHEAAHIVAARRFGAHVQGVTLSLRGGETAISGQPASPWQGVVVATAGPIVSAACGLLCGAAAYLAALLHLPMLVSLSFAWVGILSVLLAIANLIPAAPLDGGHVLQAVVWWGTGNRVRASAVSGFAGQLVGAAILLWSLWLALYELSPISAGVSAIVAWPLWRGASATRRAARQRAQLAGLRVGDLAAHEARTVPDEVSAAEAAARLVGTPNGYVAVVDEVGQPRGVLSVERIRKTAREHPRRSVGKLVRRRSPVTATPDEPLADVLERTYAKPKPFLVVVGDRPAALIEPADIRAALAAPVDPAEAFVEPADVWPGAAHEAA
jgi:Zn-dependent protease/CBS domain-containing protein